MSTQSGGNASPVATLKEKIIQTKWNTQLPAMSEPKVRFEFCSS